jgi:hypothetical protein
MVEFAVVKNQFIRRCFVIIFAKSLRREKSESEKSENDMAVARDQIALVRATEARASF